MERNQALHVEQAELLGRGFILLGAFVPFVLSVSCSGWACS